MKKYFLIIAACLVAAIPVRAQDYPKAEVFAGYSHLSFDVHVNNPFDSGPNGFFEEREGLHGVGFSGAANFSKHFGVVADFLVSPQDIRRARTGYRLSHS